MNLDKVKEIVSNFQSDYQRLIGPILESVKDFARKQKEDFDELGLDQDYVFLQAETIYPQLMDKTHDETVEFYKDMKN